MNVADDSGLFLYKFIIVVLLACDSYLKSNKFE